MFHTRKGASGNTPRRYSTSAVPQTLSNHEQDPVSLAVAIGTSKEIVFRNDTPADRRGARIPMPPSDVTWRTSPWCRKYMIARQSANGSSLES